MRALEKIHSTKIVAIDIETVRITNTLGEAGEDVKTAFAYKNKNDGEYPDDFSLEQLWVKTASLYAEFSKVCSVSIVNLNKEGSVLFCRNFSSGDEAFLLKEVSDILIKMVKVDPLYRLIGHSAKMFDYPFLCKRMLVNGIAIPPVLDHSGMKPWEVNNLDTNELWKFGGLTGSSLVAMCVALDVPISKDEMAGEMVGEYFYDGKLKEIAEYCDKDTIATFNCLRRFKFEPIFRFEDVVYINDSKIEDAKIIADVPEMPCLNQLYITKEFSDHIKEEIRTIFLEKGKTILKKEWDMLKKWLCDLYINNKMFESDTKDVAKAKAAEVSEFVNNLIKEYANKKN